MFRFRFGSTRSPKLNPSSPSSRGGVAILPRPRFQAPQSHCKTPAIWGQHREPRGCSAPSKPAAGFSHSAVTDPTPFAQGSRPRWLQTSHLLGLPPPRPPDVPVKVTVATSPCFCPALSHPGATGNDGRGQDDHNIEGAQPKQAGDLINSWPSPLPARSPLICLCKGLAQRWQPSKYVWEFLL